MTTLGAIGTGGTLSFVEGTINQSEYTLKPPSDCAKNQDHLTLCGYFSCAEVMMPIPHIV